MGLYENLTRSTLSVEKSKLNSSHLHCVFKVYDNFHYFEVSIISGSLTHLIEDYKG